MKPSSKRALVAGVFSLIWILIFFGLYVASFRYPQPLKLELSTQDWRSEFGRKTPLNPQLVLVCVDKPSYRDFFLDETNNSRAAELLSENFPWSREVWALTIDKLAQAGAKVIALDFVFAAPGSGDDALKAAMEKYKDRVVIGCDITRGTTDRGGMSSLVWPSETILPASDLGDDRVGYVNILPDPDEISRRAIYQMSHDQTDGLIPADRAVESLDTQILRKAGLAGTVPSGFENMLFRFSTYKEHQYSKVPIATLFVPKIWKANYANGDFFRDKIVLVGPTANIFHDVLDTPTGSMLGPEFHLNVIGATIRGETLTESKVWLDCTLIVAAGLISWILALTLRQALRRIIFVAVIAVGYALLCQFLYDHNNFVLFASAPIFVLGTSTLNNFLYDFVLERREKRRVRRTLERYVSKDVVKELLDNPQTFFNARGGIRRPVTILFSDVRGFTTMTESADESQLVKQLNEYFEIWVQTVFEHEGSLDKFIGDAVMAVWGNIPAVSRGEKKDAQNAVATALKMKPKLDALNESWKARGWKPFHIGIGINHGNVIVGEIGSTQKAEITAIGDAVNLASRLEGLTKKYRVDLLLGESMAALVSDYYILRTVASVQPKGKTRAANVYTVMGDGAAQTVSMPMWLARYEEGVRLYRQRKFSEAAAEFQECLNKQSGDYLSVRYLEICQNLIKNPPDESWTAAEIMTDK